MSTMLAKMGLSFNDVTLVPQHSEIATRKTVDLSTQLGTLKLQVPLISANMDSITGLKMAMAMSEAGGLGILHRYQSSEKTIQDIRHLKTGGQLAVPSIGIKESDKDLVLVYKDAGADAICIDVAHGDHQGCDDMVAFAAKYFDNVIAGNVVTTWAAKRLFNSGANIIKVGIGSGSTCTTRMVTGHGVPQITALMDICSMKKIIPARLYVISDGGAKTSGDCVKALACGADAIMSGSLFSGCNETPDFDSQGRQTEHGGSKLYRGMASRQAREQFYGNHDAVPEGEAVTSVWSRGSARATIEHLAGGIRSGLSYSGCTNLQEFQDCAIMMQVTHYSYIEGTPHYSNHV